MSNTGDGVGLIAYPWLASALTRNPILVAGVMAAQRLPWLLFSLPVGVVVDRRSRRNLMVGANLARAALTAVVAVVVFTQRSNLPDPADLQALTDDGQEIPTKIGLYLLVLAATFGLGAGEVVHDTAAMTILPQLVDQSSLEVANGRLASGEQATNQFVGPLVGAALLSVGFALPFAFDATTFIVSALLLMTIGKIASPVPAAGPSDSEAQSIHQRFREDIRGGFAILWANQYLRLLAIIATVVNLSVGMVFAVLIFFAQEVLATSPAEFSLLTIASATGSVIGGLAAAGLSRRFGIGTVFRATAFLVVMALIGMSAANNTPTMAALLALYAACMIILAVLSVSLRQAITPNEVLGRVNGVYRFFSFGAISIGAFLGGLVLSGFNPFLERDLVLRMPFVLAAATQLVLFAITAPKLSTERLEQARGSEVDLA